MGLGYLEGNRVGHLVTVWLNYRLVDVLHERQVRGGEEGGEVAFS